VVSADCCGVTLFLTKLISNWDFKVGVGLEFGIISNSLGSGNSCKLCLEIGLD